MRISDWSSDVCSSDLLRTAGRLTMLSVLRRLVRSRHASISITTAFGMTMLIGSAAFAVDLGSLYLDRRKLQWIADAAAMAAAGRPGEEIAAAARIIAANCACGTTTDALTDRQSFESVKRG